MRTRPRVLKQLGHQAGEVLLQLHFWIKLNVGKGRKPSTAIGMEKLAAECGLSFFQARRAVSKLRREGMIRTERHLFPTSSGALNLNTYILTIKAEELLTGSVEQTESGSFEQTIEVGQQAEFGVCGQTVPATSEACESGSFYSTEKTTEDKPEDKLPQPPTGASEPEPEIPLSPPVTALFPQSPPSPNEGPMPHSVHDVQGLVAAQKKVHKPNSGGALAQAWQIGMKEHLPNQLVPVGPKGMGMLKTFAKHCNPGTAEAILHFTLSEWIAFTKFCEQEAGAFKTPGTPTLQFLVKFAQQAVTFYLQAKKKPDMATPSVNPKPVTTQLIAGQVEPAPKTVSLDELLAPIDPDAALKD